MSSLLDRAADLLRDQLFTELERVEGPALILTYDTGTVALVDLAPVPVLRCCAAVDPGPAAQAPDLLMAAMLEVADVPMARLSFHVEPDEAGGRRLLGEVTADLFAGEGISAPALLAGIAAVQQATSMALEVLASADGSVHQDARTAEPVQAAPGPADVAGLVVDPDLGRGSPQTSA